MSYSPRWVRTRKALVRRYMKYPQRIVLGAGWEGMDWTSSAAQRLWVIPNA